MKVVVVQGGPSTEAFVSRKSGAAVRLALEQAGHEAIALELDASLPRCLTEQAPDVVFPAVHGAQGEDGCLQGLLEVMGLPYVGTDVKGSAIGADKIASKMFFRAAGLLVARDATLGPRDFGLPSEQLLAELRSRVGSDFVLKPAEGGSTIGISRVFASSTTEQFEKALEEARSLDDAVLVEEYIAGKEVTCSVYEDENGARALPVHLIHSSATEWYDFSSKYAPGGSSHECPAPFDPELTQAIQKAAVAAHASIGARDLSRSDFIVDERGRAFLLEINTLPGMTETSLYPEAAAAAGTTFPELMDRFVTRARERGGRVALQGRPLPTG